MFNGQKPHHPSDRFFLYFAERRGPGCCCARADKKVGYSISFRATPRATASWAGLRDRYAQRGPSPVVRFGACSYAICMRSSHAICAAATLCLATRLVSPGWSYAICMRSSHAICAAANRGRLGCSARRIHMDADALRRGDGAHAEGAERHHNLLPPAQGRAEWVAAGADVAQELASSRP